MAPTITTPPPLLQGVTASDINQTTTNSSTHGKINYDQTTAFFSGRVLTVGGVILFFLGLCCIFAVIFRFNRHNRRRRPFHTVEVARPHVLNQRAIDRSLPIRVWPSQQRLLIDDNGRVVATFKGFKVLEKNNLSEKHDLNSNLSVKEERLGARQLLKGFGFMEKLYNRNATQSSAGGSGSTNNNSSTGIDDDACKEPSSNVAIPLSDMSLVSSTDLEKVEDEACCSICLCEYTTNDRLRILPCDHEYHAECIDIWLSNKSIQCPLCKRSLLDDIEFLT